MENELLYSVALSRVKGIGPVHAKRLLRYFGEATEIFHAGESELTAAGIPARTVQAILSFQNFSPVEKEITLLDRKGIRILLFTDPAYPQRMSPIEKAPFLLYYKGTMDWNAKKMLAVIGTREPTEYGRQVTDRLIRDLCAPGLVIVSGLAYGIDGAAHRAALRYGLPTIGVLGHGFGHVYPQENADLFRAMENSGGLITEFTYNTPPDNYQFPFRNRIVAGISDAVVVAETATKGGSLGTLQKALEYGRKIFAIPGRLTDLKSSGCNQLIAKGHARLLFGAQQLLTEMKWDAPAAQPGIPEAGASSPLSGVPRVGASSPLSGIPQAGTFSPLPGIPEVPTAPAQATLFTTDASLSEPEATLLNLLREKGNLSLDELAQVSGMDAPSLAIALLRLELDDLVVALPGNTYRPCP